MHPAIAGGARRQREEVAGQGIHAGTAPIEPGTDDEGNGTHQGVVATDVAEQHQGSASQQVGAGQHVVRLMAVHQPPQHDGAQRSAQLEHGADDGSLLQVHAGVLQHCGQPAAQQVDKEQVQEIDAPQHEAAGTVVAVEHDLHGALVAFHPGLRRQHEDGVCRGAARGTALDDPADARLTALAMHEVGERFGHQRRHEQGEHHGHHTAEDEDTLPAPMRHQPGGQEAAARCTDGEACKDDGDQQRAPGTRRIFGGQRSRHGHDAAHGQPGNETVGNEMPLVRGCSHQQREETEHHHADAQDATPAEEIAQRAGHHGPKGEARQRSAQHRRKVVIAPVPGGLQRRPHEAHDDDIEAVHDHDQEAQCDDPLLVAADAPPIQQRAHIQRGSTGILPHRQRDDTRRADV